jgi:hypothetical protein
MVTSVKDARDRADAARRAVEEAEGRLVGGGTTISAGELHQLRDTWRHADLSARGARQQAEQQRRAARLRGLTAIGEQVAKLASEQHAQRIEAALRQVTAACDLVQAMAAEHDSGLADLIRAAMDLDAEPKAHNGPLATSAYVAVQGHAIHHQNMMVSPIASRVEAALREAMSGDPDRAISRLRPATKTTAARRPDHLLRNTRDGGLWPIDGELNDGIRSQLSGGTLTELTAHDIDLWMEGRLG